MTFRTIDMKTDPRRDQYEHFLEMSFPFLQVTVPVDITAFLKKVRSEQLPFFLSFIYCLGKSANAIPELRRRIHGDDVIEYDVCRLSYTVAIPGGNYRYCGIGCDLPFGEYLEKARAAQQAAVQSERLAESEETDGCFYLSSMPWTSFSGISLPFPDNRFSIPSFMIGRYTDALVPVREGDAVAFETRTTLPLCVQVHHALADGVHTARFFERLNAELAAFADGRH